MNLRLKMVLGATIGITIALMALPKRGSQPTPEQPEDAPLPAPPVLSAPEGAARAATPEQLALQAARSAALAWSRNPFAPPSAAQLPVEVVTPTDDPEVATDLTVIEPPTPFVPRHEPRLTGVSRRGTEQWAIIDGQVVTEGDSLSSGHRVARITDHSVTVQVDEEWLTLDLGEEP